MKASTHTNLGITMLIVVLCTTLASADDSKGKAKSSKQCVVVSTSAQYSGIGYKHIVSLDNQCNTTQVCDVATNVDPQPVQTVTLQAKETQDVVTRIGSAASAFSAKVSCKAG